jgi:hypothetical protein
LSLAPHFDYQDSVSFDPIQIRRLEPADAELYREVRLEALRCDSEAFGSTLEAENVRSLNWFSDRLGGSAVFGAFRDSELIGIAGLVIQQGKKKLTKVFSLACTFGLNQEGRA